MKSRVVSLPLLLSAPLLSAAGHAATVECSVPDSDKCPSEVDYLIVGAGGSGIQTALLLRKHGHAFRILEKEAAAGSFWIRFPAFAELTSVNKWARNATQRYRFDWHSMLETPVAMWDVTREYFPTGRQWLKYMNRVVEEAGIDIEFNTEVVGLATDGTPCVTLADGSRQGAKYRVFVGTGLQERDERDERYLRAVGGVRYSDMTRKRAAGKRVCVLGNGNAGFEVAQNVFGVADRVVVIGKRPTRVSAVTKYTGDVRVKFLTTLENFHGKLLDTVVHQDVHSYWDGALDAMPDAGAPLNRTQTGELIKVVSAMTYVNQHRCEVLVLATGFRRVVPGQILRTRFPSFGDLYAAADNSAVSYVGWLMHRDDFQRGAGGFLSGFRYLIRNLVHHAREVDHGVPYPHLVLAKQQALDHAVRRFQVADDLVILQDGVVVRDAIIPMGNGKYHYYEGVTYKFFKDFEHRDNIIYLYFAWGDGRAAVTVFDNVYMYKFTCTTTQTR